MAKNEYEVRDAILKALNEVYAPEFAEKDWYACKYVRNATTLVNMNMQLVTDILALFAFVHIDPEHNVRAKYYGETMLNRIINMIWNCHSGGTTAEFAARKVAAVLNVPVDE